MNRITLVSLIVLGAAIVLVLAALMMEASSGPSFRPADYDSYQECVRNIPAEWGPGSFQHDGATDACMYVHQRGRG